MGFQLFVDNFGLTCDDDQDGAEQQVDGSLPPRRNTSQDGRNKNLCWNVELQGEGDENTETVQQLHGLVRPANSDSESIVT